MQDDTLEKLSTTDLAYQRTALALERTLLAWIRTAASMISFGFTIYKFFEDFVSTEHKSMQGRIFTPRVVGMLLISFGFVGLLAATIQINSSVRKLRKQDPQLERSMSSLLAILLLMLGFALFLAALYRQ